MSKKTIIIFIIAGVVSFGAAFGVFFMINKKNAATQTTAAEEQTQTDQQADTNTQNMNDEPAAVKSELEALAEQKIYEESLTEKQLRNLIIDVKQKRKEYLEKEGVLIEREEQLKLAQKNLEDDVEKLSTLRKQLSQTIAELKQQRKNLEDSILKIEQVEKDNLAWRAAVYDKMDSTSAAKIVINMSANNQIDDAAKIIHYMSERNAAKLMAEVATIQPSVTSQINMKLKRITEN